MPSKETVSAYLLAIRNHAFTTASHTTADAEEAKLHLFQLFNHLNDGYNWMRELEIAAKQVFVSLAYVTIVEIPRYFKLWGQAYSQP